MYLTTQGFVERLIIDLGIFDRQKKPDGKTVGSAHSGKRD